MNNLENIYLSDKLKGKYMVDFKSNVLTERKDFWQLDSGLGNTLIEINKNPNIQTLYSKNISLNPSSRSESYLSFCYTEDVELMIFRDIMPFLVIKYNDLHKSTFTYLFYEPEDNPNYSSGTSSIAMGCINDPDYFRINHLKITLTSYELDIHKDFWEDLKAKLSTVG